MRVHAVGRRPATRLLICIAGRARARGSRQRRRCRGAGRRPRAWSRCTRRCACRLATPRTRCGGCSMRGGWSTPYAAFPTAAERAAAPAAPAYVLVAVCCWRSSAGRAGASHRRVRSWRAGSPLGKEQRTVARRAVERGWVRQRTWALPADLRRLWVPGPVSGRPYLGRDRHGCRRGRSRPSSRCSRWSSRRRAPGSPAGSWCRGCWITTGRRWSSRPSATSTTRPRPTGAASGACGCMTRSGIARARGSRRCPGAELAGRDPRRRSAGLRRAPGRRQRRERVLGQGGGEHAGAAAARRCARRARA